MYMLFVYAFEKRFQQIFERDQFRGSFFKANTIVKKQHLPMHAKANDRIGSYGRFIASHVAAD